MRCKALGRALGGAATLPTRSLSLVSSDCGLYLDGAKAQTWRPRQVVLAVFVRTSGRGRQARHTLEWLSTLVIALGWSRRSSRSWLRFEVGQRRSWCRRRLVVGPWDEVSRELVFHGPLAGRVTAVPFIPYHRHERGRRRGCRPVGSSTCCVGSPKTASSSNTGSVCSTSPPPASRLPTARGSRGCGR